MYCFQHVKINHESVKPHSCPICNKSFPYASYLAEHMPIHDVAGEERRYACELCNKSFMRASGLRKHTKEEHLTGPKPYVCPHCDCRYAFRCALEGHMRRHSAIRPFTCKTCGAGFKHSSNLQKHIKVSYVLTMTDSFLCVIFSLSSFCLFVQVGSCCVFVCFLEFVGFLYSSRSRKYLKRN